MKDERSRRLYDGITNVDEDLVEEAQTKAVRRVMPWVKWAAAAACVLLIAAAAFALWPPRNMAPHEDPDVQQKPGISQEPGELSEPIMGPDGADNHSPEIVPMIDSFGESTYSGDMAVANGGCVFSDSLEAAIREYGDSVRYRVMIEFFRDGIQVDSGGEIAKRECDKLSDAGYVTALETYNDGSVQHHYFTIHATAEQLRSYPLDRELGYSFLLYGEYFGETYTSAPTAFSGADSLP